MSVWCTGHVWDALEYAEVHLILEFKLMGLEIGGSFAGTFCRDFSRTYMYIGQTSILVFFVLLVLPSFGVSLCLHRLTPRDFCACQSSPPNSCTLCANWSRCVSVLCAKHYKAKTTFDAGVTSDASSCRSIATSIKHESRQVD